MKQNASISTPVYMYHGTLDDIVPFSLAEKTFKVLKEDGGCSNLHFKKFEMGHSLCEEELAEIHRLVQ